MTASAQPDLIPGATLVPQLSNEQGIHCGQCSYWIKPGLKYYRRVLDMDGPDPEGEDLCPACAHPKKPQSKGKK